MHILIVVTDLLFLPKKKPTLLIRRRCEIRNQSLGRVPGLWGRLGNGQFTEKSLSGNLV